MTYRPILFSAHMVRAILSGAKTQTRRVAKKPVRHPDLGCLCTPGALVMENEPRHVIERACPYGQPRDRLWVRETFAKIDGQTQSWIETDYRATYTHGDRLGDTLGIKKRWTPAIHMPRAASRITLEVTGVRVERLQAISDADAVAEGIVQLSDGGFGLPDGSHYHHTDPRQSYFSLWEAINGPGSVEADPWLWVIEFKKVNS